MMQPWIHPCNMEGTLPQCRIWHLKKNKELSDSFNPKVEDTTFDLKMLENQNLKITRYV